MLNSFVDFAGPSCHSCLYLRADTLIIGYVYITNTAVTLNKMIKTSLVSCNLSSMRNRFIETEGSMKGIKGRQFFKHHYPS